MQLHLSSFQLGREAHVLPSLTRGRAEVVVANALDHADRRLREAHARAAVDARGGLGFATVELDLRDYELPFVALRDGDVIITASA